MGHVNVVRLGSLVVIAVAAACTASPFPAVSPTPMPSRCPPGTLCYVPSTSPTTASSAERPTPRPAGFTFGMVPLPPVSGGFLSIADVAAAGPRFVAIGRATDQGEALVLISPDGRVWSRVPDQPAFHDAAGAVAMEAVASRSDALLVAVGMVRNRAGHVLHGAAWWSRDGEHWQRAPEPPSFAGADPGAAGLLATATGFVAAGSRAGQPAIWTSPDGRTWTLATTPTPPDGASLSAMGAGGPGLIAVGGAPATSSRYRVPLWTSSDGGQHWTQDPGAPGPVPELDPMGYAFTAVACRPGLCVAGARLDPGPGQDFAGVSLWRYLWTSSDGLHWTGQNMTTTTRGPQLDEVTWTGTAFVASGDYPQGAERRAWWSLDGLTWQEVPLPAAASTLPSWTRLVTVHGLVFAETGMANERGTLWLGVPSSS